MSHKLSLTYYFRAPGQKNLSIEGIFQTMSACLKSELDVTEHYFTNKLSRIQNTLAAAQYASTINHITGDIHYVALGLRGKVNILTIHDFGHYEATMANTLKHLFYKTFWFDLPLKHVQHVTVVSEFTKQKLIKYTRFPANKVTVIPNPVKKVFTHSPKAKANSIPKILMVGSGKHKNLNNLIEACIGLSCHIDIVGWPESALIEKLNQNKISYTLHQGITDEQLNERYSECDMLYFASFHEGFGMPIIEAQWVGRPVITSNIGAMIELAKDTAYIVDPHKPEEIKNAITALATNDALYQQYAEKGRANAMPYAYQQIARQYLQLYKNVASELQLI